jgi:hypothetical protein
MNTAVHPIAHEEIMAFLDGEITGERAQIVSKHIEECAECSAFATNLRELSQRIATWEVESFPAPLSNQIVSGMARTKATNKFSLSESTRPRSHRLIGWTIGVAAGLVVLFAIATPNLLRSRMAANEASSVGSLRSLNTAIVTYSGTYGHFPPSLKSLGSSAAGNATENAADLIDGVLASGQKSGYAYSYRSTPEGYLITADPLEPGSSGTRRFSTDQTGIISANGRPLEDGIAASLPLERSKAQQLEKASLPSQPMIARTAEIKLAVVKPR